MECGEVAPEAAAEDHREAEDPGLNRAQAPLRWEHFSETSQNVHLRVDEEKRRSEPSSGATSNTRYLTGRLRHHRPDRDPRPHVHERAGVSQLHAPTLEVPRVGQVRGCSL
jgi:hypothetical protein